MKQKLCTSSILAQIFSTEQGGRNILSMHWGKLHLRLRAVPEGTVVTTRNVLFTVEKTDKEEDDKLHRDTVGPRLVHHYCRH